MIELSCGLADGVSGEVCVVSPWDSNRMLCGRWRALVPSGGLPDRVCEVCREVAERIGREAA